MLTMCELCGGVISGIIAALILAAGAAAIKYWLPTIRVFVYKGMDISGIWHERVLHDDEKEISCQMIIEQKADFISGILSKSVKKEDGTVVLETLKLSGKVKDGFVYATLVNTDNKTMGLAAYLLKITGKGDEMIGKDCWYDHQGCCYKSEDIIKTSPVRWYRGNGQSVS